MQLNLLDIDNFIKRNNLKQVTRVKLYQKPGSLDPEGLFSEEIFGRLGSNERRKQFGYIELKTKIIHPEAWKIINSLDPVISKLLSGKFNYSLDSKGNLFENNQKGSSGVFYFTKIFHELNLDQFKKADRLKYVEFVKKNKDNLILDKFLILPAGVRDISYSTRSGQSMIQFSELNQLYESLITDANAIPNNIELLPEDILNIITQSIQRKVIEISEWIKSRLKGKSGLIRGGILKKTVDHSGRFVITPDTSLKLGFVGLPWNSILKLYEKFAINYILFRDRTALPLIKDALKTDNEPDVKDIERFLTKINEDSSIVSEQLKQYLVHVAKEISNDKQIIYKRDPVEDRESWLSANIRVDEEGYVLKLNPLDLPRTGGDFDGDALNVYALYTKQAQDEAKNKMNPRYAKSMWTSTKTIKSCPYSISKDAVASLYAATKE